MANRSKTRICLWFEKDGDRAAEFYTSLIPDSEILTDLDPERTATPLVVDFTLAGTPYQILTAGPHYKLSPAASISVTTEDQAETDRLWDALTEGGEESRCGWLIDRWGLSWQIVPRSLPDMLGNADLAAAKRATDAMMQMRKIDIAAIEAAFNGT